MLAVAAAFLGPPALAQPSGHQAIHGTATVIPQGSSLVVKTENGAGTNHSAINWKSFSIPGGSTTHFQQPNAASLSINRVVGNNPSAIFGTLSSNGRLVLVNPSGIAVGAGAVVDTAGFTASTLRMSDADARAGRLVFGGDGLGGGPLSVDGKILARSGDVVLIAPDVQVGSQALVQSPGGATLLAAGQKVELTGRGLEGIRLELQAPSDQAINLGTLQGDAVGIFAGQLKHSGLIQASAVSGEGGKVVLKAGAGDALVNGRISAVAGNQGGSVDVLGQRVGLLAGASIDASGEQGGGFVRVGGDFQGKNAEVPNAQRTYVDAAATIKADATANGDGGRVIVWADDQTQSFGAISARGGTQGGDGGFVEVSGKHRLQFASTVDTRAPMGKTGILLLDPDDIQVTDSLGSAYGGAVAFGDTPAFLALDVATINSALSNVVLQANNQIDIDVPINIANAGIGFTAQAGGDLNVNGSITTNGGAVSLTAGDLGASPRPTDGALNINQAITTNGGSITLVSHLSDVVSGKSVYISAPINAGTGAVDISGQRLDVSSAGISGGSITMSTIIDNGGINLSGATLAAGAGGILLSTSGTDANIYLSGSTLTSTAGSSLEVLSNAGMVDVFSSTLNSAGGSVNISGSSATKIGVSVNNSTVDAGSGDVFIIGVTQDVSSYGVSLSGSNDLTGAAEVAIYGENSNSQASYGGGVSLAGGLTGSGPLTITGAARASYLYGVSFGSATVDRTGSIDIQGANWAGGAGVDVYSTSIGTAGGWLDIESVGSQLVGSQLYLSNSTISTGGGSLSVRSPASSVSIYGSPIDTAGGALDISGASGVSIEAGSIGTGGGNVTIAGGGGPSHFGVGVHVLGRASIHAGTGTVDIRGKSASAEGFRLEAYGGGFTISGATVYLEGQTSVGSASAALLIDSETVSATSSLHLKAINGELRIINGSTVENKGSGLTLLEAVTTAPAPIPGIYIDGLSVVKNVAASPGEIHLVADYLDLQGRIDSGVARTMIKPTTIGRAIGLGSSDDSGKLALSQAELSNVTAGVIVIGGGAYTGDLSIESSIGVTSGALSLIQNSAASITQAGGATITVNQLNADAGTVVLTEANNVSVISGRATKTGAGFAFANDGGAGLVVGAVDGVPGIDSGSSSVMLSASGGSIVQSKAIRGSSLTAVAGGDVILNNAGNDLTAINATAIAGNIALINNAPSAGLTATASGSVDYKGMGALLVDGVSAGAAITLEADSIAAGRAGLNSSSNGSVLLKAANGAIGASPAPLTVSTSGGVVAQAMGTGGSVYLASPSTSFKLQVDAFGLASITGAGAAAMLDLRSANVGGTLAWSGFGSATLGSGGGFVSARGAITADSHVTLAGALAPGGVGSISSMSVTGDLVIQNGAILKLDFDGASHDTIAVGGKVAFPSTPGGSTLIANAMSQPPDGAYTLITGATSGDLPSVTGNVAGASLAFGSLVMNVAALPPPPPAPLPPPPVPAPASGSTTDQIAELLGGDHALAAQVVAELDTNPLTTFTTLLLQEEEKQAIDAKGLDNLVDDNQCRR